MSPRQLDQTAVMVFRAVYGRITHAVILNGLRVKKTFQSVHVSKMKAFKEHLENKSKDNLTNTFENMKFHLLVLAVVFSMDIFYDELKQNNVDIDKETLSYHINVILNKNHELYEAARVQSLTVNLSRFYKEINVKFFGRFIAYSALVYRASDSFSDEIAKIRREKSCDCKVDYPSQRRHECLMLTLEESWTTYGLDAIEQVIERGNTLEAV
ncbi:Hypothetical predicted protein [Paramuricea clavata]|uniref:Uncharacterized protein n=1 Tax=Paramuricea clavata TaxID=317549 RepID=A0A7D9EMK7_PARCT|nr:Hypothetical predicted protein [Paramuricea clavata]